MNSSPLLDGIGGGATVIATAVVLSVASVLFVFVSTRTFERARVLMTGLAGGILLAAAVLHLVPETLEETPNAIWYLLGGGVLAFVVEFSLRGFVRGQADAGVVWVSRLSLLALAIHSTLDGVIYASAAAHSHASGWATSMGLFLHEVPKATIAMMLARQSTLSPVAALSAAIGASSLMILVGWGIVTFGADVLGGGLRTVFPIAVGLVCYAGARLVISAVLLARRSTTV